MDKYNLALDEGSGCGCGGGGCCGGGHGGGCCGRHKPLQKEDLSEAQLAMIDQLLVYHYLPVARFVLTSSKEDDFVVHALEPVQLQTVNDSLGQVKERSAMLLDLEQKGFISIDYDIALSNYDYQDYYKSAVFAYFKQTVDEGAQHADFLGDTASIETGSLAITEKCADLFQGEYEA